MLRADSLSTAPSAALERQPPECERPAVERRLPSWVDCGGFIDIHCHLLPGLDDGPPDEQVCARMARQAYQAGALGVAATPHCNLRWPFDNRRAAEVLRQTESRFPRGLEVFPGCELELNGEAIEALRHAPRDFTLNRSRYTLVEFPRGGAAPPLERLFDLFGELELTPILAHPEKTAQFRRRPEQLVEWVRRGGLVQVTGDALCGRLGRRTRELTEAFLAAGLVHFAASDAHDDTRRRPDLLEAYGRVRVLAGPQTAARLFAWNGLAVLKDEPWDA